MTGTRNLLDSSSQEEEKGGRQDASEEFKNVADVHINDGNGVLTFFVAREGKGQKSQTTAPYTVREDIGG